MEHKTYSCDRCGGPVRDDERPRFIESKSGRGKHQIVITPKMFDTESFPMQWRKAHYCPGCIVAIIMHDVENLDT